VFYSAGLVCALLLCPPDTVGLLVWTTVGIRYFFSLELCLRLPHGATDGTVEICSMKLYLPKMKKTRHHLSLIYFENLCK
jgi:hypothetical protein